MDEAHLLRSISVYNNEGVDGVEHGCYDDAIVSFTNALEILRPLMPGAKAKPHIFEEIDFVEMNSRNPRHDGTPMPQNMFAPASHIASAPSNENNPCKTHSTHTGDMRFVFRDPIEIPFNAVAKSAPSPRLFSKLSIVVMYNLALAFHLSSLQNFSVERLIRAKQLYEFTFQMHLQESCDVTLLYSLALMNNLGLIYQVLSDSERSNQCFKNMLATMMFLLEANEAHTIKQWDGLLSNVMGYIFIEKDAAASAA
jgi:hypothetical protein